MAQSTAHTRRDETAEGPAERQAPVKLEPPTPTQEEANEIRARHQPLTRDMQPAAPSRGYQTR